MMFFIFYFDALTFISLLLENKVIRLKSLCLRLLLRFKKLKIRFFFILLIAVK